MIASSSVCGQLSDVAMQVLAKTLDSTQLTTDKLEVSTITRDEKLGRVRIFSPPPASRCAWRTQ